MPTPLLFQYAFRICFLSAAVWAAAAMPLWLSAYSGWIAVSPAYGAMNWHAHEMVFGYAAMVICGFLFTALPNWTGRPAVRGWPLATLVLLWAVGRGAMLLADRFGVAATAIADLAFLAVMLGVAAREIVVARSWRSLPVLALIGWLTLANVWFHASALTGGAADMAMRAAIGALIALIILIGGRLAPNFTRNWLVKRNASRLPPEFNRWDAAAIAAGVAGVAAWVAAPEGRITAGLAALAAILLALRLARWRGWATWSEPLLLVLHLGYGFVPLGFAFLAVSALHPELVPGGVVIHAWAAGAVGTMTLAVMTRATLGHTGRALTAGGATTAIYVAVLAAALSRVIAPLAGDLFLPLVLFSGTCWTLAFLGFVATYGRFAVAPRLKPAS
jgi:uncharacterized protein involved in response to NO